MESWSNPLAIQEDCSSVCGDYVSMRLLTQQQLITILGDVCTTLTIERQFF